MIPCSLKRLPEDQRLSAAHDAIAINPQNRAPVERFGQFTGVAEIPLALRISVSTARYWHTGGVDLSVGFLEKIESALADKILSHMNAWGKRCKVKFTLSILPAKRAQVRITRTGDGYWSYLGTDILQVDGPTMCLQDFSLSTPDSEFYRVIRHETGHTLGCPHEHMRREIVARIDRAKAIKYFHDTQGWSQSEVEQQVLTPLEESSILGTPHADEVSIMCYQLPGSICTDGKPIPGGNDIDEMDYAFMASIYPPTVVPPPPPPPPPPSGLRTIQITGKFDVKEM